MGGTSSYLALLSICGFLSATWAAGKLSRLVGVSSIVLEIATGVVLGPQMLGLISPEYAVCEHLRHMGRKPPPNAVQLAKEDMYIGEFFTRFNTPECCDLGLFLAADGANGALGSSAAGHNRRLGGGGAGGGTQYRSFGECLERSCETEVRRRCSLTPDVFTLVGHAGVALMIFESGMHFDFEKAKVVGLPACGVAVLGTFLPLAAGCLLMGAFGMPLMPDGVAAGTALAPTSVGIALRLLSEAGVLQENFGQAIIAAAFVDDTLSLTLSSVLFSLGGELDLSKTTLAPPIGIAVMLLAVVAATKFWPWVINDVLMPLAPQKRDPGSRGCKRLQLEKDEVLFLLMIVVLVVYSFITHLLGTHLWGCFVAGMSFACLFPAHHAQHVCCAPFMGTARWVIGWAMVGRAEFAYLIAQMALSGNMLDEEPCEGERKPTGESRSQRSSFLERSRSLLEESFSIVSLGPAPRDRRRALRLPIGPARVHPEDRLGRGREQPC